MKLKLKNKMTQAEQPSSGQKQAAKKSSSWEMSAESALRVDYVTRRQSLPLNHN